MFKNLLLNFYTCSLTTTLDCRCALPLLLCAGYDKLRDKFHSNFTPPRSLNDFTALSPHLSTQGRQQEGPTRVRHNGVWSFRFFFFFFSSFMVVTVFHHQLYTNLPNRFDVAPNNEERDPVISVRMPFFFLAFFFFLMSLHLF